jgi:hypothetical protein
MCKADLRADPARVRAVPRDRRLADRVPTRALRRLEPFAQLGGGIEARSGARLAPAGQALAVAHSRILCRQFAVLTLKLLGMMGALVQKLEGLGRARGSF